MTAVIHDNEEKIDAAWVRGLCDCAQTWVVETDGLRGLDGTAVPTNGYVDLLFSFALASLGDASGSRELLGGGEGVLGRETNEVHRWALAAFRYRITQALDGKVHGGTLPSELFDRLDHLHLDPQYAVYRLRWPGVVPLEVQKIQYAVDRLRCSLRILEPDVQPNPYARWVSGGDDMHRQLIQVTEHLPPAEIVNRIESLLVHLADFSTKRGVEARVIILTHGLRLARVAGAEFAQAILQQVPAAYEEFATGKGQNGKGCYPSNLLLGEAVKLARHVEQETTFFFVVDRLAEFVEAGNNEAIWYLAEPCLRFLRTRNHPTELARLCDLLARHIPQENFGVSLPLAAAWVSLDRSADAEPIFEMARTLLFAGKKPKRKPNEGDPRFSVAKLYAEAIISLPGNLVRQRVEELLTRFTGIRDTFSTAQSYAISQLRVIDSILLAVLERERPTPILVHC